MESSGDGRLEDEGYGRITGVNMAAGADQQLQRGMAK